MEIFKSCAIVNMKKLYKIARQLVLLWVCVSVSHTGSLYAQNTLPKTIIWKLDNINQIGGHQPTVLGHPVVIKDQTRKSIFFDGVDDGLVISQIPMRGWKKFSIEVLFKPSGDGPVAPRFIHFTDDSLNRGTFEVRLTQGKEWYMDTFLRNGKTGKGLTLIDSTLLHPSDKWYWAALTYDGQKMTSYVNGVKELEGNVGLPPMLNGELSLGVRLNRVAWFKGFISEIRFHPEVLSADALKKEVKD
ncbi:LamG domain-containing protein [Paradesertivirga mongoliensis]|uniref:LamG domain-containing protein n=1 Tax=Paradesertivirga mongoliensis TaxID=2100740 RepID=A0ABW4ZSI5_9SPHI|nr:LamG domain-containing protein [Pedobacter mongoliensis]